MNDVIRAWKDPGYRAQLDPEQLADLPAHPAGEGWPAMDENDLRSMVGGATDDGFGPSPISHARSCGYICTFTTECPMLSLCCI